ncbi:hypothetical protein E2320_012592 [Naja naja]|nr:hypothetical protein E2320_012592 [Naja naja]
MTTAGRPPPNPEEEVVLVWLILEAEEEEEEVEEEEEEAKSWGIEEPGAVLVPTGRPVVPLVEELKEGPADGAVGPRQAELEETDPAFPDMGGLNQSLTSSSASFWATVFPTRMIPSCNTLEMVCVDQADTSNGKNRRKTARSEV